MENNQKNKLMKTESTNCDEVDLDKVGDKFTGGSIDANTYIPGSGHDLREHSVVLVCGKKSGCLSGQNSRTQKGARRTVEGIKKNAAEGIIPDGGIA